MVKVAVLVRPDPAIGGSSDRVWRLEATLCSREERPSISDPTERPSSQSCSSRTVSNAFAPPSFQAARAMAALASALMPTAWLLLDFAQVMIPLPLSPVGLSYLPSSLPSSPSSSPPHLPLTPPTHLPLISPTAAARLSRSPTLSSIRSTRRPSSRRPSSCGCCR